MQYLTGILVYFVMWWIVLFAVLPWGVRPPDEPGEGHASSAPEKPRLLLKFGVTTVISGVLWLGYYVVVSTGMISFRVPA